MSWGHQRFGVDLVSAAYEKCGWGYNSIERDFFKSSCLSRF